MVNKESIGIDNDLTKDRNMNTFKTYCKRRKSGARFPDRKANNRLCACHCIAGNDLLHCAQRSTPLLLDTRGFDRNIECFSFFERYLTLPVGTWFIALEQSTRRQCGRLMRTSQSHYFVFRGKETNFVGS